MSVEKNYAVVVNTAKDFTLFVEQYLSNNPSVAYLWRDNLFTVLDNENKTNYTLTLSGNKWSIEGRLYQGIIWMCDERIQKLTYPAWYGNLKSRVFPV
jgi:hypothetical protein